MTIHCYTSISFSYLDRARVLGRSIKRYHPDWHLWLCVSDRAPDGFRFDIAHEPFDAVVWWDELGIDGDTAWMFKHDVIEVCTAVKGPLLQRLLRDGADKVLYLDPDIAVFASLQPLVDLLDDHSILLTPHQLTPEEHMTAVWDNEVTSLATGTYNLGFLAVRNDDEGRRFADWWAARLTRLCYDERPRGIFVDQKWCDLVPAFFDSVKIVRDPGYNVASWNLSHRRVGITADGAVLVNGAPLRFFHFTKLGPVGDTMTQRYARGNVEVYELWAWYRRMIVRNAVPEVPRGWWHYGRFANGAAIPKPVRELYRKREDLQAAFTDPFDTTGFCYYDWLKQEGMLDAEASKKSVAA